MTDIRACKGHLVCKAEPEIGLVEALYKKQLTKTTLAVGGKFTVEREGVRTTITRKSNSEMSVDSCVIPN